MKTFLNLPEVQAALPHLDNLKELEYFRGRFPCGLARGFVGDRFVMVGDAAGLVRAFKGKGVTSAIQTGARAAQTILHEGISARAFQVYIKANRDIINDLPYGRAMRKLTVIASRIGMMHVVVRAAKRDVRLRKALFDAVSAHRPYRDVVLSALSPSSLLAMMTALVGVRKQNV